MKTALGKNLSNGRTTVYRQDNSADTKLGSVPRQVASGDCLWTVDDVAAYCRVKVSLVRYWLRSSDIPSIKLGRQRRFDREDIMLWISERKEGYNVKGEARLKNII